jgi:ABC-type phosphate transport system ATPase subunit
VGELVESGATKDVFAAPTETRAREYLEGHIG